MDYRKSSTSYDGFENWIIGEADVRYAKFKLSMDATKALGYIDTFQTTVDAIEIFNRLSSVAIAGSGGTTVNFNRTYRALPRELTAEVEGVTPLIPVFSSWTTTSVQVQLFNSAGSDVGGTFRNLTFIGY